MLLTEEVEVKPTGKMIQYYKDKGYDAKHRQSLIVKVEDLPRKSDARLDVLCDICRENITRIRYADYNKAIDKFGSYACRDCSIIRAKQLEVARYGDLYVRTEEFKEKRKKTYIGKYGVENPLQNKEINEKARNTNLQKYGYTSPSQVPKFKEKARLTAIERYGVDCPSKNEEVKQKTRNTNIQKYGVPNTMQSPEVRAKVNETLCRNGTQKTSSQQLYLHSIYGGEINYAVSYYAVDICFPEEKLAIEYDGGGHDLRVVLGRLTQEEFDNKEMIRNIVLKKEGYKRINIVSKNDLLPSDQILLQMLSDAKQYFTQYPNHSWITYNIDTSTVRNAENKDGVPYDFGELRKISSADVDVHNVA